MPKFAFLKVLYRRLPRFIQRSRMVQGGKAFVQSYLMSHDSVYDEHYYSEMVEEPARRSAPIIAKSIMRDLKPHRVIDIGCGTGAMLEAIRNAGCEVLGFEKSQVALDFCRKRNLPVREFDLEHDEPPRNEAGDVVISMEVAEHLPQNIADRYIDMLTAMADVVVFTAAPPGQGGTDHINEQPREYWFAKFRQRNFHPDESLTPQWREEWIASGKVEWWYTNNLMIFQRRSLFQVQE